MSHISHRLIDYHVHSTYSVDGRSSIDEICQRAVELKFSEVGFCEHIDFEPSDPGFGFFDYDGYSEAIDSARSRYAGKLVIRKGAEIDYGYSYEPQIKAWIEGKEFDFLVGSVHYVDHTAFDLQRELTMPPEIVTRKYYTKTAQAAESRLFSVIGHLDFIRSYVPPGHDLEQSDMIDLTFERIIANRIHLEINSRRRWNREPFPSRSLIQKYLDKGGTLFSFGSDAHSAQHLGIGITQAMDLVRNLKPKEAHVLFE